ncbi:hypothetical protein KY321_04300 [Candidatus Woesearchaeota archaeon]|nr:hypothetical protein [Candidatus Woesearchaeota archaeon]
MDWKYIFGFVFIFLIAIIIGFNLTGNVIGQTCTMPGFDGDTCSIFKENSTGNYFTVLSLVAFTLILTFVLFNKINKK